MERLKEIILYLRHISFIAFIICIIILYSGFLKYSIGNVCLVVSFIYIIMTFLLFFIKNRNEESNTFNNIVLIFLHFYICVVAYRYIIIASNAMMENTTYFSFNFFMISLCLSILSVNKIIICNTK